MAATDGRPRDRGTRGSLGGAAAIGIPRLGEPVAGRTAPGTGRAALAPGRFPPGVHSAPMGGAVEARVERLLAQAVETAEAFRSRADDAERRRIEAEQAAAVAERLARDALQESDEARRRAAHALHDGPAQSMVSAHRFLEAARSALVPADAGRPDPDGRPDAEGGERSAALLAQAQDRVLEAIREVRAVLDSLVPPGLEELGLAEALRIRARTGPEDRLAVSVTGTLPRADAWRERCLFGIVAQALDRAAGRPGTATIRVRLRSSGGRGIITVTDDGGDPGTGEAGGRQEEDDGLESMRRSAGWLGGRVDLAGRPGRGSTVRVDVPLSPAADEAARAPAPAGGPAG